MFNIWSAIEYLVRVDQGPNKLRFTHSSRYEMTGSHKRSRRSKKVQRANHRQKIADMRLKGHTIDQIVSATGVSKSTVHRELR